MTFEQWVTGCVFALLGGFLVHALVTGRIAGGFSDATRNGDPIGYWLAVLLLAVLLALAAWLMRRAASDDIPPFVGLVSAGPFFLYLLVEALRTGEARLISKEPFTREDRPAAYWTHVAIMAVFVAFTAFVIADVLLR